MPNEAADAACALTPACGGPRLRVGGGTDVAALTWQIFGEIPPASLADPSVGWPASVCDVLVPIVLSTEKEPSLCNQKKARRLPLAQALERIEQLESTAGAVETDAAATAPPEPFKASSSRGASYVPSEVSKLVLDIGRKAAGHDGATERVRRLQQKTSEGFKGLMARLDHANTACAADAPDGFEERLRYWHARHAIPHALHERLQTLRTWRNASEHGDDARWRAHGPKGEDELVNMLSECDGLVTDAEERRTRSARA